MSGDCQSLPVSLPPEVVERLDELVGAEMFGSRSDALRYGARLVVGEERVERLHEQADRGVRATYVVVDSEVVLTKGTVDGGVCSSGA
ncbi:ribbon-helix-helix domain-containing protein [Haloplanus natans]|uniref:ribbon-helix-helix domain-containing protein n=1 Tax=Haloplanus natans TaxID=376171 RepID=UPI001B7FA599|nr:ribbon-helix-helix domain-containing protein [Haloplanus natans]